MSFFIDNERLIQHEMKKLRNNVILKLFTDFKAQEDGSKIRRCMACDSVLSLLKMLAQYSDGKLNFIEFSIEEDTETTKKYNITRLPTILFLDENDKEVIRYVAEPNGNEFVPFLKIIQIFSGSPSYYKDAIITNLKNINKSKITLFITQTCPYCPQCVPVVSEFALLSKGKITTEIIDINANQDMAMKYQITGVPHTMINETEHIYGMFTPQVLLDNLTKGKRDFGGMYA